MIDYEPKEQISEAERLRRRAMPLGQDYRHSHFDPKTTRMTPPRGESVHIPSRGF
jgi:hypothetical protein